MPACYFHEQSALTARAKCPGLVPSALLPVFRMGSQGPDLLFSYRVLSMRNKFIIAPQGRLMHRTKTGDFLRKLGECAQTPASRVFALGFLTHYATDATVHPYVLGHELPHLALEKRMDRALYRRNGQRGVPQPFAFMAQTRPYWDELSKAWARAAQWVYPQQGMDEAMVMEAFHDTQRISRLTHSPTGVAYAGVRFLEQRILGKPGLLSAHIIPPGQESADVLNLNRRTWYSPYEPERMRDESLPHLLEMAATQAAGWMIQMDACWQGRMKWDALRESLGQISYSTGLSCEDE